MKRREFITLLGRTAAAWPLAARAQQQLSKPRRIGLLTSSSRPVSIESSYHAGILLGMRELGYVEGKDFIIEWRFAEGKLERFADFAAELVQLNVDVLVPATPTAIPAVRQATRTIPIVMAFSTDPVGNGFIASLAHPGGNITGLASSQDDAAPKQMEFLGMAVPNLSRLGLLVDRRSPNSPAIFKNIQDAARTAGVAPVPMEVDNLYQKRAHSLRWPMSASGPSLSRLDPSPSFTESVLRSLRSNIGCHRCSRCASSWRLAG